MCYKQMYLIVIISFWLFTVIRGSCLEYGHSCWGAHGKRSGGIDNGKPLHDVPNIRNREGDDKNGMQANKLLFQNVDDLSNQLENNGILRLDEGNIGSVRSFHFPDVTKLQNLFRKQNKKPRNRNSLADGSIEHDREREEGQKERWPNLSIFNRRPGGLVKSQMENSENELLHQPPQPKIIDESFYYDFS